MNVKVAEKSAARDPDQISNRLKNLDLTAPQILETFRESSVEELKSERWVIVVEQKGKEKGKAANQLSAASELHQHRVEKSRNVGRRSNHFRTATANQSARRSRHTRDEFSFKKTPPFLRITLASWVNLNQRRFFPDSTTTDGRIFKNGRKISWRRWRRQMMSI